MRMRLLFLRLPMWPLWNANDKVASAKKKGQDQMLIAGAKLYHAERLKKFGFIGFLDHLYS